LVPLPLGLVGEPLGAELSLGGVEVAGGVDGIVVDGGEADGDRSPGRPPTRSVRDSLQAVSMPMLRATAQSPVSILFMREPPPCGDRSLRWLQPTCRGDALTRSRATITNAEPKETR
jgi:hypothetical protein